MVAVLCAFVVSLTTAISSGGAILQPRVSVIAPPPLAVIRSGSEGLVLDAMRDARGERRFAGFLVVRDSQNSELKAPYPSQYGLQGRVIAAFQPTDSSDTKAYVGSVRLVLSILLGLTAGLIAFGIATDFGATAGLAFAVLFALSDWPALLATNLYWVAFSIFLPFALSWALSAALPSKLFWVVPAAVAAAVFGRALCGYEYITNTVLAAAVPPMFHAFRDRSSWRLAIIRGALVAGVGTLAFLGAMAVHVAALSALLGSREVALAKIRERAAVRSVGAGAVSSFAELRASGSNALVVADRVFHVTRFEGTRAEPVISSMMSIAVYLMRTVVTIPEFGLGIPTIVVFVFMPVLWYGAYRRAGGPDSPNHHSTVAIGWLLLGGFVASASWGVFAFGHMMQHTHLDTIVFYVPFFSIAFGVTVPLCKVTFGQERG